MGSTSKLTSTERSSKNGRVASPVSIPVPIHLNTVSFEVFGSD